MIKYLIILCGLFVFPLLAKSVPQLNLNLHSKITKSERFSVWMPLKEADFRNSCPKVMPKSIISSKSMQPYSKKPFSRSLFYLEIQNASSEYVRRYLQFQSDTQHVQVCGYDTNGGLKIQYQSGRLLPFYSRPLISGEHVFPINLNPNGKMNILIKLKREKGEFAGISIINDYEFSKVNEANIWLGIYLGIAFGVFIYNLFLYYSLREKVYLWYTLTIISEVFYIASNSGFAHQYLWPSLTHWNIAFGTSNLALIIISFSLFTISFLENIDNRIIKTLKFISLISFAIMIMTLGLFALGKLTLNTSSEIVIVLVFIFLITFPIIVFSGVLSLMKGFQPAQYFVIAWGSLMLAGFYVAGYYLYTTVVGPANIGVRVEAILQFASAFEMIMLSTALGYRVRHIKREAELAKAQAIREKERRFRELGWMVVHIGDKIGTPLNILLLASEELDELDVEFEAAGELKQVASQLEAQVRYIKATISKLDSFKEFAPEDCVESEPTRSKIAKSVVSWR